MFEIVPGMDYAVVTGDIIDSSSLTAQERAQLPQTIHRASQDLLEWLGEEVATPLAVFGGDSWQLLMTQPGHALGAGLFVRASLMASPLAIDTRVAIAIAGVDFVPDGEIEQGDGEAFRLSGRLLGEGFPKRSCMGFAAPDERVSTRQNLIVRLVDELVRRNWNENRARAITGALRGWTDGSTGELWTPPITRQTVNRHLEEAGWDAIEVAVEDFMREWGS